MSRASSCSVSPARRLPVCLLLAVAIAPAFVVADASAQSRRDRAAVEALQARMDQAELRYREAMVRVRNEEPGAAADGDAALEDMEDVMVECGRQRGCDPVTYVTTFKRLLKAGADSANVPAEGEEADPFDPDPDGMGTLPGGASVPAGAQAAALLTDGQRFATMVQFNPAVQEGIRRWLTDMRVQLLTSYENYQYMRPQMWPNFEKAGLPEALLFGILAKESNGRVHSTSRAGAAGPMQFMYATGRRFGIGPDATGFDTRYDPYAASQASAAYLTERMRELDKNIELALAGYNGGEGRARRVFNEGGVNFWDESVYRQFPPETRDYVPMVIAAAWLFLHPRRYGLEFPDVDTRPAVLALQKPASIYELTICLGSSGSAPGYMRVLRNLNPRYRADEVIPAGTQLNVTARMVNLYNRWCTRGSRAQLAHELVRSDPAHAVVRLGAVEPMRAASTTPVSATTGPAADATPAARRHRVNRGETLGRIAQRYGCDLGVLARANELRAPSYAIRPGQELTLAGCSG
ncbi:transglycosylase SLT domain-containing protein [Luteimonas sp. YGD11-2]|uniref:transglycosylase SLT domain-containing protein n=1 Tax=Luteimonas sp. YGD11-2 TaxID=2508168 RepID=UPI00100BC3BB|nr:transglycosylase SLT domain-containing protein [Luteimonas sp. YGD11-2]